MPLFEFICKKCNKKFEKIVFSINNEKVECPVCKSSDVEKQFSVFASGSSKSSSSCGSSHASCKAKRMSGGCSGGCCGM